MRGRPRGTDRRAAVLVVVALGLLVGLLGFDAATGARLGGLPLGLETPSPTPASGATYSLAMTITVNATTGLDQVSPANLSFPLGVPIRLTITNYDTGANPVASMWGRVMGTSNGAETVAFGNASSGSSRSWIAPSQVSHTFTILPFGLRWTGMGSNGSQSWGYGGNGSMMGGGSGSGMGGMGGSGGMWGGFGMGSGPLGVVRMPMMMVNLPIPAAADNSTPAIVSATLLFETPGQFQWSCVAPCDTTSMASNGFMRGTLSIS